MRFGLAAEGSDALLKRLLKPALLSAGAVDIGLIATALSAAMTVVLICRELP